MYVHSNALDYGKKASGGWDQTVTVYEPFRAPMFIPAHIREVYETGTFKYAIDRSEFNGTDAEYQQLLPGHFMDKWVSELATTNLVRLMDEMNTPGAKLPQYLFVHHCEHVWRMGVQANILYKVWLDRYVSKYYDKVDDFYLWNRLHAKEQVDYIFKKDAWKLKKEHEHRMIRKGYGGRDIMNKSLGKYFDIERAFHGYPGPLTTHLNHKFKNLKREEWSQPAQ